MSQGETERDVKPNLMGTFLTRNIEHRKISIICSRLLACYNFRNTGEPTEESVNALTKFGCEHYKGMKKKIDKAMQKVSKQLEEHNSHFNKEMEDIKATHNRLGTKTEENKMEMTLNIFEYFRVINENTDTGFLLSFLRPIQIFNVEKRFGLVSEYMNAIISSQEAQIPSSIKNRTRMHFATIMNDTEGLLARGRPKREVLPRYTGVGLIDHFKQNLEELADLMTKVRNEMAVVEEPENPSTYYVYKSEGIYLPRDIPKKVIQWLQEMHEARSNFEELQPLVEGLCEKIWNSMHHWRTASQEIWEWGKEHKHDIPILREYEMQRASYSAQMVVYNNVHSQVHNFFKARKEHHFARFLARPPDFVANLRLNEGWDRDVWQKRALRRCPRSVEDMITRLGGMYATQPAVAGSSSHR